MSGSSYPHGPAARSAEPKWGADTFTSRDMEAAAAVFYGSIRYLYHTRWCLDLQKLGTERSLRHVVSTLPNLTIVSAPHVELSFGTPMPPWMAEAFHKANSRHSSHLTSMMLQSCRIVFGHYREHDSALWLLPKLTPYPLSVPRIHFGSSALLMTMFDLSVIT
jgi:hypothetical protein